METKKAHILELITQNRYTKKEIAEIMGLSVASVSTHMTYLRWRGWHIIYDRESRIMRTTNPEGHATWVKEGQKNRPTEKQEIARLHKRLEYLYNSQIKWAAKRSDIAPGNTREKRNDYHLECEANLALLKIHIKRAEATLWEQENTPTK